MSDLILDSDAPPPSNPEARPAPRRRRMVLGVLAVAAGAAVATAIVLGPSWARMLDQRNATLETPAEVAGLTLDESEPARGTADYLRTALAADLGLGGTVGGVYTDPAAPTRSVIFVGGTAFMRSPEKDLDRAMKLLVDETGDVSGIRDVAAGELGGVMKCGTTQTEDDRLTVCGWADHGTVALALFPDRDLDDSAGLLRDMRTVMQHRA